MNQQLSRRNFLVSSAAATAVATAIQAGAAAQESTAGESAIPIVDTHEHLWDLSRLRLPWLNQSRAAHFRRSYLPKDYDDATSGINIVKTVYMEVNCDPADHEAEADYVIKLCQSPNSRMRGAVIGGSVDGANFPDYIKKYATNPHIKGVRMILNDPDRPKGLCLKPTFVKNVQYLGELGLSYDICIRPAELLDAVHLIEQCPKTRFIIDHCGNRDVQATDEKSRVAWEEGMKGAAAHENAMCKISGIVATAKPKAWQPADLAPAINFCLDTFGPDRVFFGGDWPVCTAVATYRQWFDALTWILRDRSPEFRRKLLHDNAVRFYKLT
jgi:predicted TIM-barrel fold metal-dependent hydrolase